MLLSGAGFDGGIGDGLGASLGLGGGGGATLYNLLASVNTTAARNDFGDYVGWIFQVGAANITLKTLGRFVWAGNTQSHDVVILQTSSQTILRNAAIDCAGATSNAFAYALVTPLTLVAGTQYMICSQEYAGGDLWKDLGGEAENYVLSSDATADGIIRVNLAARLGGTFQSLTAPGIFSAPTFQYERV